MPVLFQIHNQWLCCLSHSQEWLCYQRSARASGAGPGPNAVRPYDYLSSDFL